MALTGTSAPRLLRASLLSNFGDGVNVDLASAPVGDPVEVTRSSIFGNSGFGINNATPVAFAVAGERNYWGDDTGPFDPSDDREAGGLFNGLAGGQSVSDGVDYDPWIRLGPSVEGVVTPISGLDQIGQVGEVLPEPIVVEILSTLGSPLEGIEVIFSVVEGDASIVETQPLLTGADGRASAMVQLGAVPGAIRIAATARDVDSPLAAFLAEADAPCLLTMTALPAPDSDGDTIMDPFDNCIEKQNIAQRDTDGDGFGNRCDADLNGDGMTDSLDLEAMKARFFTADRDADLNGDAVVDFLDLGILRDLLLAPPGP